MLLVSFCSAGVVVLLGIATGSAEGNIGQNIRSSAPLFKKEGGSRNVPCQAEPDECVPSRPVTVFFLLSAIIGAPYLATLGPAS